MSASRVTAPPELLTVRQVAAMLGCSPRHVCRLSEDAQMPAPVRIGALVRWNRTAVEQWLASGCKPLGQLVPIDGERQ
jgi:excisionase family DNA binding protein